jgi:hypothetical protein
MAGEIALLLPDPDEAEEYFEHALAVARQHRQSPGNCVRL